MVTNLIYIHQIDVLTDYTGRRRTTMTIGERKRIDKRMARLSAIAKFTRNHIHKGLGERLSDKVYDLWEKTY